MRSSKMQVVIGGLFLTGGGRACPVDAAKSLVLRGCLRQKMGRRRQAEADYRKALRICHGISKQAEPSESDQSTIVCGDEKDGGAGRPQGTASGADSGGRADGEEDGGLAERREINHFPRQTVTSSIDGSAKAGCFPHLPPVHGTSDVCDGTINGSGDCRGYQDGHREVLRLESLIHHNLATLHLAAVLGADMRPCLHKAAALREALEFEAREKQATGAATTVYSTAAQLRSKHERWWHSTVLTVARMVSTTDAGMDSGRKARLELGSAEIAAKMSSGYSSTDAQALPGPFSLIGAARARALVAVRVNLAAAEKVGALSAPSASSRRQGLANAVETITSAIETTGNTCSELYIERAGLLAIMGDGGGGGRGKGGGNRGGGGEGAVDFGKAAAADLATALWIDSQLHGRAVRREPVGESAV